MAKQRSGYEIITPVPTAFDLLGALFYGTPSLITPHVLPPDLLDTDDRTVWDFKLNGIAHPDHERGGLVRGDYWTLTGTRLDGKKVRACYSVSGGRGDIWAVECADPALSLRYKQFQEWSEICGGPGKMDVMQSLFGSTGVDESAGVYGNDAVRFVVQGKEDLVVAVMGAYHLADVSADRLRDVGMEASDLMLILRDRAGFTYECFYSPVRRKGRLYALGANYVIF